ncbi:hypothetical protein BS78_03G001400 [Paspalum vaginatum]|nr:hypothetical protein BS78_03G001400 [Paspalum vaginatum]
MPLSLPGLCALSMTGGGNGGGACAVCKHQRRKCEPNCELAAYFPAHRMNDFRALHLVFGVANLTKLIKANASEAGRRRAAETLTWEARWRERDPSEGCYREVSCLRRDNAVLRAENAALRRQMQADHDQQQLVLWSRAAAAGGGAAIGGNALLHNNGMPPSPCVGGSGVVLTAATPHHHAPAAHAMPMPGYRGSVPVCPSPTAANGRRPPVQAVDASRESKSNAAR